MQNIERNMSVICERIINAQIRAHIATTRIEHFIIKGKRNDRRDVG